MPWAAVSDRQHDDPETYEAGAEAMGLWAVCRSWIAHNLTDGKIPASVARAKARALGCRKPDAILTRLVKSELWRSADDGGFFDVTYLDQNPSKARVLADAAKKKARQETWLGSKAGRKVSDKDASRDASHVPSQDASRDRSVDASKDGASPLPSPSGRSHTHNAGAGTSGQAREAGGYVPSERQPSDPFARQVLAELRKHPSLAEVVSPSLAETLAMAAQTAAKRPEDVLRAVAAAGTQAAVKANVGEPLAVGQLATLLRVFCGNANPPKPNGHGPKGTPTAGAPRNLSASAIYPELKP